MNILVSGSLAYDKIMNFSGKFSEHILPDKIHNLNVSFLVPELKENYGGTAGNIAYNLKLLGEKPTIIATAGKDFARYQNWLFNNNIDTTRIKIIKDELTATAYIITDRSDNQISAFHLGAMGISAGDISEDLLKDAIGIVAPGNIADMNYYPNLYKASNIPYIFDPGQNIPSLSAENLQNAITGAKVFISNDYELALVLKKTGLAEKNILERTQIVITTLGEKGSIIKTKNEVYQIQPVMTKKIVDPTGAGDAYRAGLIKGLIDNLPLPKIGELASALATRAIEHYGTQNHKL